MKENVTCVDNDYPSRRRFTFVNNRMSKNAYETWLQNRIDRDFNIRRELCNFAQILKPKHDTRNPYRGL